MRAEHARRYRGSPSMLLDTIEVSTTPTLRVYRRLLPMRDKGV